MALHVLARCDVLDNEDELTPAKQRELRDRERDLPLWLLASISFAILGAGGALLYSATQLTSSAGIVGAPSQFGEQGVITRLDDLAELKKWEPDPVGRRVALRDVPVVRVTGDYTFWVGSGLETGVLVALRGELMWRQPESRVTVEANERISVYGVVRDLDVLGPAVSELEPEELSRAEALGYFIHAERVFIRRRDVASGPAREAL